MNTWTSGARAELERYLAAIRRPLEQAGADAVEVIEDLKRHIEADIAAARLRVVTVTDLKPMLARIGGPLISTTQPAGSALLEANAFTALDSPPEALSSPQKERVSTPAPKQPGTDSHRNPGIWLLICGVIVPALILLFEFATGFCARHFFNPIPGWGHVLLVAFVPVANGFIWWALRNSEERRFVKLLGWFSAVALGISVMYSLVFLPLFLPAIFALIFFGLGLLPLTPLITACATGALRKGLKLSLGRDAVVNVWPGIAVAALAFLLVDIRHIASTIGLQRAASEEQNSQAVSWLRK